MRRNALRHGRDFRPRGLRAAILAIALLLTIPVGAQLEVPSKNDRRVAQKIAEMLDREHLTKLSLNDTISERTFANYIEALDPQKMYFYQSDVAEFGARRTDLDDMVQKGNLEWAWSVFRRFLERVDERVVDVDELLARDHDFTVDEEIQIDRDDASFAATPGELRELWRKRIKYNLLDKRADRETPEDAREQLGKRYHNFGRRMHQTSNDELLQIFMTALTQSYDPHTSYMSAKTLENFEIAMRLELEGIGASLISEDGYTIVNDIVAGGAADRDGTLQPKDKIVAVAQGKKGEWVDVVDWKLTDVVQLIRGEKGTIVRLKLKRPGVPESIELILERARVELKDSDALGEVFEQGTKPNGDPFKVGVIELRSFYSDLEAARRDESDYKSTTRDVHRLLRKFRNDGVDAVVVDLRYNGGGSLTEAIRMTGLFIDDGPVVQVKDARGRVSIYEDEIPGESWKGPLVVLTNQFSASASEIFAGAIQDYRRGLVVGDPATHGKGTVQNLEDIGRRISWLRPERLGALKITRQQFYRPSGDSTQNRGVLADLELPSVTAHYDVGEAHLDFAIPFDSVPRAKYEVLDWVSRDLVTKLSEESQRRVESSADFQKEAERIERHIKFKGRKFMPLNETKFMAEYQALNGETEPVDPDEEPADKKAEGIERSFYLEEALAITQDYYRFVSSIAARTP